MPETIHTQITNYLKRYMYFANDDQPLIVALWTIHTWTFSESFPRRPWTTPYLYVHSAQKQSGKTLLIDLLESLVLNPERTVDMSSSVLFRLIEAVCPALFIDEVDTVWSGAKNEALRGVLNGGYKRGGYVWRTVNNEPTKFATFSPKLLAGIDNGQLPDTIADRCIPIQLVRKPKDSQTEIYYSFQAGPIAETIAESIGAWVTDHGQEIVDYLPKPIDGISPRAFEIAMPLLQIAHTLGVEPQARESISRLLAPRPEADTPEIATLREIKEIFDREDTDKLHTAYLCEQLGGLNGKRLAGILRPFGITGNNTMQIGNRTAKGYWRHQFLEVWETFL